jgi:hypothetical protein
MDLRTQREAARWYPLIAHPMQMALIGDDKRFKVVPAGRRSGKTERAKRLVAKFAMRYPNERYFLAAPTRDQAKGKFGGLICGCFAFESLLKKRPSESNLDDLL